MRKDNPISAFGDDGTQYSSAQEALILKITCVVVMLRPHKGNRRDQRSHMTNLLETSFTTFMSKIVLEIHGLGSWNGLSYYSNTLVPFARNHVVQRVHRCLMALLWSNFLTSPIPQP
jgi:protein associated with RNAse G/E